MQSFPLTCIFHTLITLLLENDAQKVSWGWTGWRGQCTTKSWSTKLWREAGMLMLKWTPYCELASELPVHRKKKPPNSFLKVRFDTFKQTPLLWKELKTHTHTHTWWLILSYFPILHSLGIMTPSPQPQPPSFVSPQKLAADFYHSLNDSYHRGFLFLCPWIWWGRRILTQKQIQAPKPQPVVVGCVAGSWVDRPAEALTLSKPCALSFACSYRDMWCMKLWESLTCSSLSHPSPSSF